MSALDFHLRNLPDNFTAGKVKLFLDAWEQITSDCVLLSWVQGVTIDFDSSVCQGLLPKPINFDPGELDMLQKQLDILLAKGIIVPAEHCADEFVSNIFYRPKKDGGMRLILNLRRLNEAVAYHHFKMETLHTAITLMKPNCWMASVDLKDAYFSVPVHSKDRKYLRFFWKGQLYEFTCLPNGLAEAPRKFTKMLKAPFSERLPTTPSLVVYDE